MAAKHLVQLVNLGRVHAYEDPVANTNSPVLVTDVNFSEPQHLRSEEALRLMGFPSRYNRAEGITEKDYLILTGQSDDSNVTDYFALYWRLELMARADVKRYLQDDKEDNVNIEALVGCVQLYHWLYFFCSSTCLA